MADSGMHKLAEEIFEKYNRRTSESKKHNERAKKILPGGDTRTATYFAPHPVYMDHGRGCRLYDVDGNEYLDFLNNYTSLIHGHAHPDIVAATKAQLEKGTVLGSAAEIQYQHAEHLCGRLASADMVRYCNSGTEATLFAIRAARAFTGKDAIIKMDGGYHGSHDLAEVNIFPDPNLDGPPEPRLTAGVPESVLSDVFVVRFNDLEAMEDKLKAHSDQVAAIITEPLLGAAGAIPPRPDYLAGLRELADKYGVLLIIDEVMTFRLSAGGMQAIQGVTPDITAMGKIIGGGLPVGAFGGRSEIMSLFDPAGKNAIFHSGTFNGNNVTMAAGLSALKLYDQEAADRLNGLGDRLRAGFETAINNTGLLACMNGYGSMLNLHWTSEKPQNGTDSLKGMMGSSGVSQLLKLELMNRGLYSASRGMFVPSTPMTDEDIDSAIRIFGETLEMLKPYIEDESPHLLR